MANNDKYLISDMEEKFKHKSFKTDILLIRNGQHVGIYKYLKSKRQFILTKSIVNHDYGKRTIFEVSLSGDYWGSGGTNGVSAIIQANEAHFIPSGFDLRDKNHLEKLNKCLGGCYSEVYERLQKSNPKRETKYLPF